jgi:hypothetical protein
LVFGSSNLTSALGPLPLDLAASGMPGCFLRVSPDVSVPVLGAGGLGVFVLAVPSVPALAGMILHSQAIALDNSTGSRSVS